MQRCGGSLTRLAKALHYPSREFSFLFSSKKGGVSEEDVEIPRQKTDVVAQGS